MKTKPTKSKALTEDREIKIKKIEMINTHFLNLIFSTPISINVYINIILFAYIKFQVLIRLFNLSLYVYFQAIFIFWVNINISAIHVFKHTYEPNLKSILIY